MRLFAFDNAYNCPGKCGRDAYVMKGNTAILNEFHDIVKERVTLVFPKPLLSAKVVDINN
jgi:ABC-type sulfate transport system substrate-binding protein